MSHIHNIFLAIIILLIHETLSVDTDDQTRMHSTLNYLNQLQHRIDRNINLLNNRIPQLSSNLYYNIQDIASRSKIPNIISSLKNQITDSSECGLNSNNQINTMSYNSKADISKCVDEAILKSGDLAAQTGILLHKANGVKNEVTGKIGRCVKNNVANEVALAVCLVAQVHPIEESLGSLEQEIQSTFGVVEKTAQTILIGLSECLIQTEDIITEMSNNVIKGYQDCKNLNHLNGK